MSAQDLAVWQASQPNGVPFARFSVMRSLNSPLWGSLWHAVHVLSSNLNGRILSLRLAAPSLWQSTQATAACAPDKANRVLRCLAMVNVERWKSITVWQISHLLLYGAAANWLSCASLWQSPQAPNFTL